MIYASRNGQKRTFTDLEWKEMPREKYGWNVSADEPDEVKAYREKVITKEDIKANPELDGLEGKTIGLPVVESSPAPISSFDEIAKIEAELQTKIHHLTRKKLENRLAELKASLNPAEHVETQKQSVDATGNE